MCKVLRILFKEEYAEGRAEVRENVAKEMLLDGKSDAEILKYSKLSEKVFLKNEEVSLNDS